MIPQQKLEKIRELKGNGKKIAMVGDGVNDAPALIESDVGIAMGSGTALALECADMALVTNNLDKIVSAFRISRQCMNVIRFNFWGTIVVDVVGVALAPFGLLTPLIATHHPRRFGNSIHTQQCAAVQSKTSNDIKKGACTEARAFIIICDLLSLATLHVAGAIGTAR